MKNLLLFGLLIGLFFPVCGQVTFQKTTPFDNCSGIRSYANGDLLLCGAQDSCALVVKMSASGEVIWSRRACPTANSPSYSSLNAYDLIITADQRAWVLSYTNGLSAPVFSGTCFDVDGDVLWTGKLSGDMLSLFGIRTTHLRHDSDNDVWTLGLYAILEATDTESKTYFDLTRISATDYSTWSKRVMLTAGVNRQFLINGLFMTNNDHVLVFGTILKTFGFWETDYAFILCFDQSGQLLWSQKYPGIGIRNIESAFANGDILATGHVGKDFLLLRITPNGGIVWGKKKEELPDDFFWATCLLSEDKQKMWMLPVGSLQHGISDSMMLYHLDQEGNFQKGKGFWNCKYHYPHDGIPTHDDGFVMVWGHPEAGAIITKVNPDVDLNTGCIEREGGHIDWSPVSTTPQPYPIQTSEININPIPEVEWVDFTTITQDFCPEEEPNAYFEAPDTVCAGTPLYLMAEENLGESNYIWETPGAVPAQYTGLLDTCVFEQKGQYQVQLIQEYGFCRDTFGRSITATGLEYTAVLSDTLVCDSSSVLVNLSHLEADAYLWDDGDSNPVRYFSAPGTYSVTISEGHCTQRDSFLLERFTAPVLMEVPDSVVCVGAGLYPSPGVNDVAEWLWDGQSTVPPFDAGIGELYHTLVARFNNGCLATDSIWVNTIDCEAIADMFIPNVISLAGDEANRYFEVFSPYITPIESSIYDRWGEQLYHTARGEWPHWAGDFRGQSVPSGVYVFTCKVLLPNGKEKTFTRDLTVLR